MIITQINSEVPWMPAQMDGSEADAFDDLIAVYSPYGQIKNLLMVFRPGIGIGGYQGSVAPLSLDHSLARMIGMGGLATGLDRDIYGGGKGLTLFGAVASSLGEGVERMIGTLGSFHPSDPMKKRYGTFLEVQNAGLRAIGSDTWKICAPEETGRIGFLCDPWTDATGLSWVVGTNLLDNRETWLPEQLVHLFYPRPKHESRIGVSSSGGLATHISDDQALSHAILELIERDQINLSWYGRIPPRKIVFDRPIQSKPLQRWIDSARRSDVELSFFHHTLDINEVSVVTVIAIDRNVPENSYLAGGGVGLNVETAMTSAVTELVQAERMVRIPALAPEWELARGYQRMFGIDEDSGAGDFDNFIQVVSFYGFPSNQSKLDWYFRPTESRVVNLSELPARGNTTHKAELDEVLRICHSHGLNPVAYDLTPSSFEHVRLRKVIVPELVPAFPPNMQMLGHDRYYAIRQIMGLQANRGTYQDLTTDPLPFP